MAVIFRMAAVSISFLSRLACSLPQSLPFLLPLPGGGHPRRHAAFCVAEGRTAPHSKFFALATRLLVNLANCDEGERRVQPRALSPANLRIDSPPSRSAFQTVPGHPEADEAGCCVDIAGLGETGVDGQFQLRRGGRSPVQPCTPSPANVQTHSPPSRSTLQSIPGHQEPFQWRTAPMLPGPRGLCFVVAFHCAGRPMAPPH